MVGHPAAPRWDGPVHSWTSISFAEAHISRPTILAILALPAAAIGYAVTAAVLSGLQAPDALLLIVPLFVAALCMVPFVLPYFDRMAKRDLEAHRAEQADHPAERPTSDEPPTV